MLADHAGEDEILDCLAGLSLQVAVSLHEARDQPREFLGMVFVHEQCLVALTLSVGTLHHLKVDLQSQSREARAEIRQSFRITEGKYYLLH